MDVKFKWVEMLLKEGHVFLIVLACLFVFYYLKDTLIGLISRMNSLKIGEHEMKFGQIASEIEAETLNIINEIPHATNELPLQVANNFDKFIKASIKAPNPAVLSAWRELELTAITLAYHKQLDITGEILKRASGIAAIKAACENNLFSEEIVKIYEKIGKSIKPISEGKLNCQPVDAVTFCQNAKRLSEFLSSKIK